MELREPVTLYPHTVFVIRHVARKSKALFARAFPLLRSIAHIRGHDRIAVRTVAIRLSCEAPSLACIDMPW